MKDRKGCENQVADHLSRLETNEAISGDFELDDTFPDDLVMSLKESTPPWYADFANYIVSGLLPDDLSYYQKKRFIHDVKRYFWDEPYLFRECTDGIIRQCVMEEEIKSILEACHSFLFGGHHGGVRTAMKVL